MTSISQFVPTLPVVVGSLFSSSCWHTTRYTPTVNYGNCLIKTRGCRYSVCPHNTHHIPTTLERDQKSCLSYVLESRPIIPRLYCTPESYKCLRVTESRFHRPIIPSCIRLYCAPESYKCLRVTESRFHRPIIPSCIRLKCQC